MGSKNYSDKVTAIIRQDEILGCFLEGRVDVDRAAEIGVKWAVEQFYPLEAPKFVFVFVQQGYARQEVDQNNNEITAFYSYEPEEGDKKCISGIRPITIVALSLLLNYYIEYDDYAE